MCYYCTHKLQRGAGGIHKESTIQFIHMHLHSLVLLLKYVQLQQPAPILASNAVYVQYSKGNFNKQNFCLRGGQST